MQKVSYPKLHSIKLKNQSNVINLSMVTYNDIDPNKILIDAINEGMEEVVVLGYTKDGTEYFASSKADGADTLWHLQRAQTRLLSFDEMED